MNQETNGVQRLPLDKIQASPLNPRKHFDKSGLQELAASIKAKGVLEPILVRNVPMADRRARYSAAVTPSHLERWEIVFGERRFRAALLAGLDEIPALIRQLSDKEVLEVQVIENEQRADLSPLEKAEGYRALLHDHGYSVGELAAKVGKSPSTIHGLVKLLKLPADARKALEGGRLPAHTAQLIARIPDASSRAEAAKKIVNACDRDALSFRGAKNLIEGRYMVELKGAPFARAALDLVPAAGSCDACPKRTGNNRDEYPDARADVCTDPACYRAKLKAHGDREVEAAKAAGKTVLADKAARKVFPEHQPTTVAYDAPYVDLAATQWIGDKRRSWKQLVGEQLEDEVVLAHDGEGRLHQLVPKAKAQALLRKDRKDTAGSDASWRRRQAKQRQEELLKKEVARRCMGKVAEFARLQAVLLVAWPPKVVELFRLITGGIVDVTWADINRQIAKRRGLETSSSAGGQRDSVQALVPTLDGPACVGLLAELVAGTRTIGWSGYDKTRAAILGLCDVNYQKVTAEVRKEWAARSKKGRKSGHQGHPL